MFGLNIERCVLAVQVVRLAENRKSCLCKITLCCKVKIHIVGLKPKLAALFQDLFVCIQLASMGKALFVVAGLTPRVAEIDIDAVRLLVFCKERVELFDIIGKQSNIFNRLFAELRFDIAARNTENVYADVNTDEVHIAVAVCKCCKECTLTAAEVEMQRLFFFEKGLPCTGSLSGSSI